MMRHLNIDMNTTVDRVELLQKLRERELWQQVEATFPTKLTTVWGSQRFFAEC